MENGCTERDRVDGREAGPGHRGDRAHRGTPGSASSIDGVPGARSGRWEYGEREESAGAGWFPEAGTLPGDPAWTGGTGLRKGRRDERDLAPGDPLDFWRVSAVEPNRRLLLVAEMKLPGCATLEFRIGQDRDGFTRLHQISTFAPRGLAGVLYWKAVYPFHHRIFSGMIEWIARSIGKRILAGPEHLPPGEKSGR